MTFAAIPWLSIATNLLLFIFVIVCLLMILLILMQRPKQEGLGAAFGAGVTDQVFGARTTNVLQRGTVYLGTLFFVISFALSILIAIQNRGESLVGTTPATPAVPAETSEEIVEETVTEAEPPPATSLADELPEETAPPAEEQTPEAEIQLEAAPEAGAPEETPTEPETPEEESTPEEP